VIHSGAFIGAEVPVWDIAERFGDRTNLLVTDMAQGRDLAGRLGANSVALMRGHGFAAAARSLIDVVRLSVYLPRNARVQFKAMQLGELKPLSPGEINARAAGPGYKPQSPETQRACSTGRCAPAAATYFKTRRTPPAGSGTSPL